MACGSVGRRVGALLALAAVACAANAAPTARLQGRIAFDWPCAANACTRRAAVQVTVDGMASRVAVTDSEGEFAVEGVPCGRAVSLQGASPALAAAASSKAHVVQLADAEPFIIDCAAGAVHTVERPLAVRAVGAVGRVFARDTATDGALVAAQGVVVNTTVAVAGSSLPPVTGSATSDKDGFYAVWVGLDALPPAHSSSGGAGGSVTVSADPVETQYAFNGAVSASFNAGASAPSMQLPEIVVTGYRVCGKFGIGERLVGTLPLAWHIVRLYRLPDAPRGGGDDPFAVAHAAAAGAVVQQPASRYPLASPASAALRRVDIPTRVPGLAKSVADSLAASAGRGEGVAARSGWYLTQGGNLHVAYRHHLQRRSNNGSGWLSNLFAGWEAPGGIGDGWHDEEVVDAPRASTDAEEAWWPWLVRMLKHVPLWLARRRNISPHYSGADVPASLWPVGDAAAAASVAQASSGAGSSAVNPQFIYLGHPYEGTPARIHSAAFIGYIFSDPDGSFCFPSVAPGRYTVVPALPRSETAALGIQSHPLAYHIEVATNASPASMAGAPPPQDLFFTLDFPAVGGTLSLVADAPAGEAAEAWPAALARHWSEVRVSLTPLTDPATNTHYAAFLQSLPFAMPCPRTLTLALPIGGALRSEDAPADSDAARGVAIRGVSTHDAKWATVVQQYTQSGPGASSRRPLYDSINHTTGGCAVGLEAMCAGKVGWSIAGGKLYRNRERDMALARGERPETVEQYLEDMYSGKLNQLATGGDSHTSCGCQTGGLHDASASSTMLDPVSQPAQAAGGSWRVAPRHGGQWAVSVPFLLQGVWPANYTLSVELVPSANSTSAPPVTAVVQGLGYRVDAAKVGLTVPVAADVLGLAVDVAVRTP